MKLNAAVRNHYADYLSDQLDGGTIEFRTGTAPTDPDTTATGTLLGAVTCNATFSGAASAGAITANAFTQDSSADNTGTIGYARGKASGGTAVIDFSVGTSGADIIVPTLSVVAGQPIQITSMTITFS